MVLGEPEGRAQAMRRQEAQLGPAEQASSFGRQRAVSRRR